MIDRNTHRRTIQRRGLALGLVLLLGIAILVVGMSMIAISGGALAAGVDSKQKIKSRMAAQSLANMQMAKLVEQASRLFGAQARVPDVPVGILPTGDSCRAGASVEQIGGSGSSLAQEKIASGAYKGMMGLRLAYKIHSTGLAPGGAKSRLDAEIRLYQVPVFQFGVFYEGDLEICPGLSMVVGGPVHTNGTAYFRAPGTSGNDLEILGPVTTVGSVYQWAQGAGRLKYRKVADLPDLYIFSPGINLPARMTVLPSFPEVDGVSNLRSGAERMKLPIDGAAPRELITPNTGAEPASLARQKFASRVACTGSCPKGRWVNGESPLPAWIKGPRVFFDRREQAWVKFWDFSVKNIDTDDSVFYLADTTTSFDRGSRGARVINAFRIVDAGRLPRNLAITTPNPVYLVGEFNAPHQDSKCAPAGMKNPPDSLRYCNAMIASDAFTLLSPEWPSHGWAVDGMSGTLERDFADPHWTELESVKWNPALNRNDSIFKREPTWGSTPTVAPMLIRVHAAILTGNKPSNPAAFPPGNYSDGVFEQSYEGGWHNTIRFLERLRDVTTVFKGSFVCMWSSATPGMNLGAGRVMRPLDEFAKVGYYSPPKRLWSFDDRFRDLSNMPPATPFLSTAPAVSFAEIR